MSTHAHTHTHAHTRTQHVIYEHTRHMICEHTHHVIYEHTRHMINEHTRAHQHRWRGVKCRGAHTCAITMSNQINRSSLECWGHNGHTQSVVPAFAKQVLVPQKASTVPIIRSVRVRALQRVRALLRVSVGALLRV